jgi:hypothetical protein
LISLASSRSIAYQYKRLVLALCHQDDRSVFGEDLFARLSSLNIRFNHVIHDSYMDVTAMLNGHDETLFNWTRYFCRLSLSQLRRIGAATLRTTLRSVAVKFSALPIPRQMEFLSAPAACGVPKPDSMILPHCEVFVMAKQ